MSSTSEIFRYWFQADFPLSTCGGTWLPAAALVGFIFAIAFIAIALLLLFIFKKSSNRVWKFVNNNLTLFFGLVWTMGFVVYDVGMCTGDKESLLLNAPMAVLHAFGMFVLTSDVSAIQHEFHDSWLFMAFFSAAHFLAAVVSLVFVIEHFGYNIIAGLKMSLESFSRRKRKETFVFWGLNAPSYQLAKSIDSTAGKKDRRIIFIRTNNDSDTTSVRNGMERLFHFLSLKNEDLKMLQDLDCLTTNTFFSTAHLSPDFNKNRPDILRGELNLKRLSRIIKSGTSEKVHMFFFSDDPNVNIQAVAAIRRDATINEVCSRSADQGPAPLEVIFYCGARAASMNRVIEEDDMTRNIEVRIIDAAHLSIECLKRERQYQPISMVDIDTGDNPGTVASGFTSLIVGFGATGRDALRFLYEFGAFVDNSSQGEDVKRSPFHCHVVDKDMARIRGHFINSAPAIMEGRNIDDGSPLVELHDFDHESDDFYNTLLASLAPTLNYVVIATGDDRAGMTLAIRILKFMRRSGRNFERLRIFVRSYDPEFYPHMTRIADHYNENGQQRIITFGDMQHIYSYPLIIMDEFTQRAQGYYDAYRALNPQNDQDGTWRQRQRRLKALVKLTLTGTDPVTGCRTFTEQPVSNPEPASLNSLQQLRRKETQDRNNALHETTKMAIVEQVIPSWYTSLASKLFDDSTGVTVVNRKCDSNARPKTTTYPGLTSRQQLLMDNLAKLEHLRWNASHEVLGYTAITPGDDSIVPSDDRHCCEERMMHNCLVPWGQLDYESDHSRWISDYKVFDYGVVETTINIYRKNVDSRQQPQQ